MFDATSVKVQPQTLSYHYPDIVIITCAKGYLFGGGYAGKTNITMSCQSDGTWDVQNLPFCERAYCGFAPSVANGYIEHGDGVQGGDSVMYRCDPGFSLVGNSNITCLSEGKWSDTPSCEAPTCERLSTLVPGANITLVRGDGLRHGSVAMVKCPQYQEIIGPETMFCDQGTWNTSVPSCRPKPCAVPRIVNSDLNYTGVVNMSMAINVQCHLGYGLVSSASSGTFRCGVDTPLVCSNINECTRRTHNCTNATCSDTDGSYSCTCLAGYIPVSGSQTHCQDVDECATTNGLCDHNCTNQPGSYQCTCSAGYLLYTSRNFNGFQLLPTEDGTKAWHTFHINHSCVPRQCNASQVLAIREGKAMTSQTFFYYQDRVEYICNVGYFVQGTNDSLGNATCGADGQWSKRPICEDAFCVETHGPNVTPVGSIPYGMMYTLRCILPNNAIIQLQRICGYDKQTGTFKTTGDELVCPEVECGPIPIPTGMKANFAPTCNKYNCTVIFECEPYYERKGRSALSNGNPFVICNADGYWDFGTLFCQGGQCGQPVTPYNGYTQLSSWRHDVTTVQTTEIGAVATFHCKTLGYEPMPVYNTTCIQNSITGQAIWSYESPVTCVDKQPPVFSSCPSKVQVGLLQPMNFAPPSVIDNTAVKSIYSTPLNVQTGTVAGEDTYIYFHAEDYTGLTATCTFPITLLDIAPPKVICRTPPVITAQVNGSNINPNIYFTISREPGQIFTNFSNPAVIGTNFASIGTNPILSFTATDGSGNHASCRTQMKIEAPKCTIGTLEVRNGDVSCVFTDIGLNCTSSCHDGYSFYENPSLSEIRITCSSGGEWNRAVPVCTVMHDHYARTTLSLFFSLQGILVDQSCTATYQTQASNTLVGLEVEFKKLCSNALNGLDLDIVSPADAPVVASLDPSSLAVNMTFDIRNPGLSDSIYQSCFNEMRNALNNKTPNTSTIHQLQGRSGCMTLTLTSGNTTDKRSFVCSGQETAVHFNSTMHVCMVCPPGTYSSNQNCMPCSEGTYNDQFSRSQCVGCPPEANSKTIGASSVKGCYEDCGMRLYSLSGKPPCSECPVNTYWNSSTTCLPCPAGTYTDTSGAYLVSECRKLCPPGSYSHTGLEPCTPCPRNFYQSSPGSKTCTECPSELVTTRENGTSTTDCVDGASTLCSNSRCANNGQCSVIRHAYYCNCTVGFTGRNCENELSPCVSSPCLNGAMCTKLNATAYKCTCKDGYSGDHCENNRVDCAADSCVNNGTCIDGDNGHICACSSHNGFYGPVCNLNQNPCLRFPCNNSGVCKAMGSYHRVCYCPAGFSGHDCQINLNECAASPCMNGARCQDGDNRAICVCPAGFRGHYCEQRDSADICTSSVCNPAKSCIDNYVADTHYCVCPDGWYFDYTSGVCGSFDKDIYCPPSQCTNGGECTTYDGGYHVLCRCGAGYGGPQCQQDVNECLYQPCRNNGTCTNLVNNYTCACPLAAANGTNCIDSVNGCQNCVVSNTKNCSDYLDGYVCHCKDDFRGNNCQEVIPTCEWLPCQHGGTCTNPTSPGEHVCTCAMPWTGRNCETEIDNCKAGSCLNGATCESTSNGFICLCPLGYIGVRCEITYDLCDRARLCVGANNTCKQVNQESVICICQDEYTGESCESLLWYCKDTTCKNGGQCSVVNGYEVVCSCLDGYSGPYCETNIDECSSQRCPPNSVCVDGLNSATCVCRNGKIGENCDKDVTSSFDIIINPNVGVCDQDVKLTSFLSNSTTAFTLAFWVRLTTLNSPGAIVTVYGMPNRLTGDTSNWQHKLSVTSTHVNFNISTAGFKGSTSVPILNNVLHNGLWHHVTVTWSNAQGFIILYVDGIYNNQGQFAKGKAISLLGLLYLGSHLSELNKFEGRLSQLKAYYTQLDDANVLAIYQGSQAATSRISLSEVSMTTMYTVDYASQLTNNFCRTSSNCLDRAFNETSFPRVVSCTEDTLVVTPRVSSPKWTQATFSGTSAATRLSTHISGKSQFVWGLYSIGTVEHTSDKMAAAVCTFRLYNRRRGCTPPLFYNGNAPQCTGQLEDGYVCKPACTLSAQVPTIETPKYFTCGKYAMWDDADRVADFMIPTCGTAQSPQHTVSVTMEYVTTSKCAAYKPTLITWVQKSLTDLNVATNYGLCKVSNGGSDALCSGAGLAVDCMSDNMVSVQFSLKYLSGQVTYGGLPMSPQKVLKIAMRDQATFTYLSNAIPFFPSLNISTSLMCSTGHQLIGDKCVLCGDGYYYNSGTSKCLGCNVGQYRTVQVYTNPLSSCENCSGSGTTDNTGTPASTYCHYKCYLGQFYNSTISKCMSCDYGEYSDSIGASICSPCGMDKTTNKTGSIYSNSCIAIVTPTQGPILEPAAQDVTLSSNGTNGATVFQGNALTLTCAVSQNVVAVYWHKTESTNSSFERLITGTGFLTNGSCGNDPAPPAGITCACVSTSYYVCTIQSITTEDHGDIWRCRVFGSPKYSSNLTIIVNGPPQAPHHVQVLNVNSNSAEVSWLPGFHGGYPQTFVIQTSTDRVNWRNASLIDGEMHSDESPFNKTLSGLETETLYWIRLFSFNIEGKSDYSVANNVTTAKAPYQISSTSSSKAGVIAGSIVGGLVGLLVVVTTLVALRKYELIFNCKCVRKQVEYSLGNRNDIRRDQPDINSRGNDNELGTNPYDSLDAYQSSEHVYSEL
ncbi:sushi, von Willebrand factor type A, EGF and pentraxin domain-containing protein 1-like [Dreissena polymorpha]|uniref:sushi, von Willebrand factor type A, EGF and pentraxin domain-containing protein 1-like n=1 Tax=Dreissena polymorpha TaxID=45954 RepID=UPI002264B466|nr:sushi, von Willebrand factor type A, EGF and pentraxin domain-containing protein 1-like [Dreissena polymorpha]